MIALDSWVWIEFFLRERGQSVAEAALRRGEAEGAVLSTLALAEIWYVIARKLGISGADQFLSIVERSPNLRIVPVNTTIAKYAAQLRLKYYSPKCQLSYADAVHLATAIAMRCSKFVSGDGDFSGIAEIPVEIV